MELAAVEDRQGQRDVIEVAAGDVGIVGDVDVAGFMLAEAEVGEIFALMVVGGRHAQVSEARC